VSYQADFERSIADPVGFWAEQARKVAWYKPPEVILSRDSNDNDAWFADGELNSAYLALDHHVESGRGDQVALIYDSPSTGKLEKYSYTALRDAVAVFAGALQSLGVTKGDRVIIYMPMIPEAIVSMLACARIGAVHSVVFGGFAARELATRIDDATPKVMVTASCGIEFARIIPYKPLVDEARTLARHKIDRCVVYPRPECVADLATGDVDWFDLIRHAAAVGCVSVKGSDPLYILYTSGTTGKPKGVVRDNGGHAVALQYSMEAVYGVAPGEVFWAASDVGWVVGHSYIVYAPLFRGCTTILFEGKPVRTPDAGTFWRVIAEHGVNVFFTAPTAFRAIRKEDPSATLLAQYDVSSLRTLFVAGERTDPPTYQWLCDVLKVPVVDHWWQTETGWPIAANPVGIEPFTARPGSATFPVPGFNVKILSPDHEELGRGGEGDVAIKLPLPPGCLPTVWGNHDRYAESYLSSHPGYYQTGDGGYFDADGYLFIMGRTDDVINVAGHRMSTGEIEEVVAAHMAVAECAVIGIEDRDKGQIPAALIVLKDGANITEAALTDELVALVRKEIGAFANFRRAAVVVRLPKTRSGKILRLAMRRIADGKPVEIPATIDDPLILEEIRARMLDCGIGLIAEQKPPT
jgi:propionyl-CoA synthetase